MGKKIVGKKYFDMIGEYVEAHKKDAFTKLLLVLIIVFLIFGYLRISRNMQMRMEIPPVLRESGEIKVGYDSGNDLFFKVWGEYFVGEYTSLEPGNAVQKLNRLLSMTESEKEVVYREGLEKKARYIKKNNIRTSYIPSKEEILPHKQDGLTIFHSEGLYTEKIGRIKTNFHCEYNVGMRVYDYRLLIGLMNESCKRIGEVK